MPTRVQEGLGSSFLFGKEKKWVYVHPDHLEEDLAVYLEELSSQIGYGKQYDPWRKVERLLQERLVLGSQHPSPKKEIEKWQKLIEHASKISDLFTWLKIPEMVLDESDRPQ